MATLVMAGALTWYALGSDGAPELLVPTTEIEEVEAPAVLSPREYLFANYPSIAGRMSCVIWGESRWDPSAQNPRSGAAGLSQILLSTWLTTPPGRRGESRFNPYSNIDGAAWLALSGGGWRHWAATVGGC